MGGGASKGKAGASAGGGAGDGSVYQDVKKNYDIGAELGKGAFAVVKKCKPKKGYKGGGGAMEQYSSEVSEIPPQVAIKFIKKDKVENMMSIVQEIQILTKVNHPNIIKLFEVYDGPKEINLVMELVTGGELLDRIVDRPYSEKDAAKTMGTLCSALDYLHSDLKIVHRDLKPENLLYSDPSPEAQLKVADFGLARFVSNKSLMKTACGTPGYVAPEILKNDGYDGGAVDVWSAGVILYTLLCGFPPFHDDNMPDLFDKIIDAQYDFPSPHWDNISQGAKDLIKAIFQTDVAKRLSAAEIVEDDWVMNATDDTPLTHAHAGLKGYNVSRRQLSTKSSGALQ